jgi:ribose transport system substrate-binding protein
MRIHRRLVRIPLGGYVVVAIAMATCATACGSSAGASSAKTYTIAVTVNSLNGPYTAAIAARAKVDCARYKFKCEILDPELNATTQASQLETAITQQVSAVLYFPVNVNTERPILEKLKAAHIPVINWGSRVNSSDESLVLTYAGENSTYEGNAMGKQMCKDTAGKPTEVGIVAGLPGSNATVERTTGFMNAIKACTNLHVVANEPANFDEATALTVAQDMLQSHPNLGAIYAEDDYMAQGVLQAVKTDHRLGKILLYGVGGEKGFVADIEAGEAEATVQQDPWSYADTALLAVRDVLAGKKIPTFMPIAMPVITKVDARDYTYHW